MSESLQPIPDACAACTIVSPNYLAYARTVAASYLAQHPGQQFFVLIVADLTDPQPFAGEPFTTVLLPEIGLDAAELRSAAMMYDILELNTNVKPSFMKHLLARFSLGCLVYLDPDIFCYAPLTPVFTALREYDAVLTPHLTSPIAAASSDGCVPGEQEMLYNGTYNLGFIAVRPSPEALRLLDWWERRCLELGFSEGRTGLFVDQKWMNLAPGLFGGVKVLRDRGCNMAYWNLNDRTLGVDGEGRFLVNGAEPLRFFHFSGIELEEAEGLSRNTDRFTLASRPDLRGLFTAYRRAVGANRTGPLLNLPYGFATLSDGTAITRLARRIFSEHRGSFAGTDPFDAAAPFARFARTQGLLAGKQAPAKSTWKEFSAVDRRVEAVHRMLRLALRVLGANRYELLMRYLAYITVLRYQATFLRSGLPEARR